MEILTHKRQRECNTSRDIVFCIGSYKRQGEPRFIQINIVTLIGSVASKSLLLEYVYIRVLYKYLVAYACYSEKHLVYRPIAYII